MRIRRTSAAVPWTAFMLVTLLAVLSGCATIPHSGPVLHGRQVEADPRTGLVQLGGEGPVPGATPEQVVSGFLNVAPGFTSDHKVARSFLTEQKRLAWRPDEAAAVYPSVTVLTVKEIGAKATPTPTPAPSTGKAADSGAASADMLDRAKVTRVTVTTPISAQIDRDGRYTLAPPGKTETVTFGLLKIGGEWRINALANGILISENDFAVTFRPFPVYFGDPTGRYLVPDLHWFPGTQDVPSSPELPTALVRALLQGPPEWLAGAVVSGAPANTGMAVAAVVVADDVATVDLTEQVRLADTRQRQLLVSQLEATLSTLLIGSVQITVRRLAFDVPAGSSGSSSDSDASQSTGQPVANPWVDVRPVMIDSKGRLARLDDRKLDVVKGVDALSAVAGANRPAVSNDSSAYAVLNADRSKLLLQLPGAKVVSPIAAANLTGPSFDPLGWVWTAPGTNTGFVYAAGADSGAVKVQAPWLKGSEVVSMRMSRDGTRAVLAVRIRGHAHLFLTGVLRDVDGKPLSLSQPPPGLLPDLQTVRDVAWVEETKVVVLGKRTGSTDEGPWLIEVGGGVLERLGTSLSSAESITAGKGEESVMAGTPLGIQGRDGALWETVSPGKWPAFPG